jgi:hypothetical protein
MPRGIQRYFQHSGAWLLRHDKLKHIGHFPSTSNIGPNTAFPKPNCGQYGARLWPQTLAYTPRFPTIYSVPPGFTAHKSSEGDLVA